jgi:hypothetical protein
VENILRTNWAYKEIIKLIIKYFYIFIYFIVISNRIILKLILYLIGDIYIYICKYPLMLNLNWKYQYEPVIFFQFQKSVFPSPDHWKDLEVMAAQIVAFKCHFPLRKPGLLRGMNYFRFVYKCIYLYLYLYSTSLFSLILIKFPHRN